MIPGRSARAGRGTVLALAGAILFAAGCVGPGPSVAPVPGTDVAGADTAGVVEPPFEPVPGPEPEVGISFPTWSATFGDEDDTTAVPPAPVSRLSGAALDSAWSVLLREEPRVPPSGEQRDWILDGDNLVSVTADSGQVMHILSPRIWHRSLRIRARDAYLQPAQDRLRLVGDVLFADPGFRGRSDEALYSRNTRTLHARGYVVLKTDTLEVRGREAVFDRERNVFLIRGDVRGRRGNRDLSADEAEWFRDGNTVHLRGHALVTDPDEDTRLGGQEVVYDLDADEAFVPDRPELVLNPGDNPTRIVGNRLWVEPGGNSRVAGRVEITRGGVVATADSAVFYRDRRVAVLLKGPVVRDRDGTLRGDTLFIRFDADEAIERVDVHGHANVRFAPRDSLERGETSMVRGDSLTMSFFDGTADEVLVFGDAYSTYEPAPGDDAEGTGTNAVKGDSITIFLDAGRVDEVHVNGRAKGVYAFAGPDTARAAGADTTGANAEPAKGPDAAEEEPASAGLPDSTRAEPGAGAEGPGSAVMDSTLAAAGGDSTLAGAAGDSALAQRGPPVDERFRIEGVRPTTEKVIYQADTVVYTLDAKTVDLLGNITLDYGPLTLTAGKVRFYAARRYLDAEDSPVLLEKAADGTREVVGHRMDYNLDTREGTIDAGRTKAEDGFIYSDRLRQVGDDDYIARNGNFTTCDLAEDGSKPHFHFTSNKMRIYMKDKVVAKPVTLYIRDIPVFALPFYVFSVRKGRHSGLLTPNLDFGLGGTSGRFFRNLGYYWAASDYFDLTFSNQYAESDNRYVGELSAQYKKRYLMEGNLKVRRGFGGGTSQWDIVGAHNMTLGEWTVTGRAEFRNLEFRREDPLGPDFESRLDRVLKSDISARRSFAFGANLALSASRTKDLAAEPGQTILTEQLPSYSFTLNSRTLGRRPDPDGTGGRLPALADLRFNFSSSGRSVRTEREEARIDTAAADTTIVPISERTSSAQHRASLSYQPDKILGALSVSPSISATEYWVDREYSAADTVKKFARAAVWSAGTSIGTTVYGTFKGLGPVEALRHIFRPSATFTYQPDFPGLAYTDTAGRLQSRFPGVRATESKVLSLSMQNSLAAKVRSGETTKRVDLLQWNLSSGYNFVLAQRGERAWSDIRSVVELPLLSRFGFSFNSVHDPYHGGRFKSFGVTAGYGFSGNLPGSEAATAEQTDAAAALEENEAIQGSPASPSTPRLSERSTAGAPRAGAGGQSWRAAFRLSYDGTRNFDGVLLPGASLNSSFNVQITKNWSVNYQNTWDITEGEILGETLSLHRDLHCWEAQFSRSRLVSPTGNDDITFYFRINVKQLSDIKYELGRTSGLDTVTGLLP